MSTTTTEHTGNNGVLTAARLNLVGVRMRVGTPWLVVAAVFLFTLLLEMLPSEDAGGSSNPGVLVAVILMIGISYLQTMTQTFGFALSLGITRRTFYLGIGLVVVGETLLHAIGLTVLRYVERATGGWGLDVRMFDLGFLVQENPAAQVLAFAGPLLGLAFLSLLVGVVFKRWGQTGIVVAGIVTTVVLGSLAALAGWLGWWPQVGAFLSGTPALVLTTVYPVLVALVAGVGGYLLVRRATP